MPFSIAILIVANVLHGQSANTVRLSPSLEVEFASASALRISRGRPAPAGHAITADKVAVQTTASTNSLRLQTDELVVDYDRKSDLLSIAVPSGLNVYKEAAVSFGDRTALELEIRNSERIYGLGGRPQAEIDARGLVLEAATPFFISSRGYGHWMRSPGKFEYDVGKSGAMKLRITGPKLESLEYFFGFGPSTKEIFEERSKAMGAITTPSKYDLGLISMPRLPSASEWLPKSTAVGRELLCAEASALVHASISGVVLPAFDLARYRTADDDVFRRALRLGTFSPVFVDSQPDPLDGPRKEWIERARTFRSRLSHFLITYADEARYRGYPMLHPLMMQFPLDPEAGRHIDAFMFGDEFLLIPVCGTDLKREAYLPMGIWTDWNTGQTHRGKQRVSLDVPADGLIILAKNGALMPLAGLRLEDPAELHYFPKNGGEFFIFEPEVSDYTQAHAGPAAGIYRVQIESKVARKYEWVVHHMDRPKGVAQPEAAVFKEVTQAGPLSPGTWRYDSAQRELHIGVDAPKNSDIIVNILFE